MTKSATSSSTIDRATAYAVAVTEGWIIAGPHVRNACRRHLEDLKHAGERGWRFDIARADKVMRFFETRLRLSEGQFEGRSFELHPSQAFIIGSLFGWVDEEDNRRFQRAYIEQGKGNGKSPLAGGIGLFGLTADGEAGAQIYAAAAKKDQAMILFRDAVKMRDAAPELAKRVQVSGAKGKEWRLSYLKAGSFFETVSREAGRSGSGPRPHFALCDEVHEHPDRSIMEMLERGFKFRRQPLLLMITNSGTDRNSVCWEEHEHAIRCAAGNPDAKDDDPAWLGEVIDDRTFAFVCSLDPGDDPLDDESCWEKANPLLGVTISRAYLRGVVAQAKAMPGKLNGILRLHFCVWTDAERAWITRAALEPCLARFDPAEHHGKPAFAALDLSQTRDITAKALAVETGTKAVEIERDGKIERVDKPTFDVWVDAWTPGDTLSARALRDKQPYPEWVEAGYLQAPKGQVIAFRQVAQSLAEDAHNFDLQMVAYDRYAFRRFETEAQEIGLAVRFEEHPQGGIKRGKPGDGMAEGLWFPGSLALFEEALLQGRLRLLANPVLISAIMSAVTDEDKWGNRWLAKERSRNKIDAAVAAVMAVGAAHAMPTPKRKPKLMIF